VTVDEELNLLDDAVRRLKVEYDVYFGGGSKRPPEDSEWRVKSFIKRYSDTQKLNFAQRFKYNTIVQRYAIYSDLWRQKMKIKEEGYRRPQDELLGIQGLRTREEHAAARALSGEVPEAEVTVPFRIRCADVDHEPEKVKALFNALREAHRISGQAPRASANLEAFTFFVRLKTDQIRREYGCQSVEYAVELQHQRVKLMARPQL
jgi:hypothetical protein